MQFLTGQYSHLCVTRFILTPFCFLYSLVSWSLWELSALAPPRPLASPKTKPSQRPDASWQSVAIESPLWRCVEWILSGGAAVCTCRSVCACVCLCVGVCTRYLRVESTWLCVSAPPGALRQLFVCLRWAACSEIHTYANVWSGSRRPRAPRAAGNVKIIPFLSTSLFTPQNHAEALCWQ